MGAVGHSGDSCGVNGDHHRVLTVVAVRTATPGAPSAAGRNQVIHALLCPRQRRRIVSNAEHDDRPDLEISKRVIAAIANFEAAQAEVDRALLGHDRQLPG